MGGRPAFGKANGFPKRNPQVPVGSPLANSNTLKVCTLIENNELNLSAIPEDELHVLFHCILATYVWNRAPVSRIPTLNQRSSVLQLIQTTTELHPIGLTSSPLAPWTLTRCTRTPHEDKSSKLLYQMHLDAMCRCGLEWNNSKLWSGMDH